MTTLEIKQHLISKISVTEDQEVLSGVLDLLEFELSNNNGYLLSESQKESIAISKQQIIEGKIYSEEEADALTEKWINE
jgi:hypothetical protein